MSHEIAAMVATRRTALREDEAAGADLPLAGDTWGIALSGGGIRSATFCFGLLHAFARQGLLLRFDLLSTVSGGGYIGSMLGRLFHRAGSVRDTVEIARALARGNDSWFAWWLRANGRYLVPQGLKDNFFALAVYVRNVLGIHLELGLVGLILGVLLAVSDLIGWKSVAHAASQWWWTIEWAREWLAWVPTLYLLLPPLLALALVWCWSFWVIPLLVPEQTKQPWLTWAFSVIAVVVLAVVVGIFAWYPEIVAHVRQQSTLWDLLIATIVVLWFFGLLAASGAIRRAARAADRAHALGGQAGDPLVETQDGARSFVTKALSATIQAMAVVVVVGALDRVAWWLAFEHASWVNTGYALAIAAAALRVLLSPVSGLRQVAGGSKALMTVMGVLGRVLTFGLFAWWVAVVHSLALKGIFVDTGVAFRAAVGPLLGMVVGVVLYLGLTGSDRRFLNLSSLHGFYRARLVRSYLGSVNPWRFLEGVAVPELGATQPLPRAPEDQSIRKVNDVDPRDDLPLHLYEPHRHGGPVHLINVCLNETTDPRGGLFNRDRRGRALTVGPGALLRVGRGPWQKIGTKTGENLTLGSWMAISGAAVSPGLGSMTRGGISSLAMFAGARLGFWWDSAQREGTSATWRSPLSKTLGVLDETFGNFGGPNARDWFLTDGGHFENTGAYALLAEKTRVIVVADCGADPEYRFRDLENLVRKARIDLAADIEFLKPKSRHGIPTDPAQSLAQHFGSLNDLGSDASDACFALARIDYGDIDDRTPSGADGATGYLILVKPNLCSGLPVDLFNFKADHPEFPQQGTADQFFDEAQWESYFQLGNALGQRFDRRAIERMLASVGDLFVRDDGSPVGDDNNRKKPPDENRTVVVVPVPPGRTPARLATATTAVGLGAVSALTVALWQAIEAVKTAHDRQVKDERAALKELTDLWARMTPDPATRAATANALAATLARVSDTLCPDGDAGWFNRSPLAVDVLSDTLKACTAGDGAPTPRACEWLVRASNRNAEGARSSCLMAGRTIAEQQFDKDGCASYWAYDYRLHALAACAHPTVLAKRDTVLPTAMAASAARTQAPTASAAARACDGKTVLPMIYGPRDLARVQRDTAIWRGQGLGVETARDLEAIARESGRSSPLPVDVTTIRYRDPASLACAQALPGMVQAQGWRIEPAAEVKNARPGLIEVWVAPGSAGNAPPPAPHAPPRDPAPPQPPASNPPRDPVSPPPRQPAVPAPPDAPVPLPPVAGPASAPVVAAPCQVLVVPSCACATVAAASSPPGTRVRPRSHRPATRPAECVAAPTAAAVPASSPP